MPDNDKDAAPMTPEDTTRQDHRSVPDAASDPGADPGEYPIRPLLRPRGQAPSIHTVRARKLLFAGLTGGLAATVVSLILCTVIWGLSGLGSAALAAAMVLFFYVVGQYVMVMFADAGARTLLIVSMTSYTARVVVLGLVLLAYVRNSERWPTLTPMAIFVTTILVVVGWLGVEIFVFNRLRISIYDAEYKAPAGSADQP